MSVSLSKYVVPVPCGVVVIEQTATFMVPPSNPKLLVQVTSPTTVDMSWCPRDDATVDTVVFTRTNPDGSIGWSTSVAPGVVATDNTAKGATTYTYSLTTKNAAGSSPPSDPAKVTTPPAMPTSLTAAPVDAHTINLSWK